MAIKLCEWPQKGSLEIIALKPVRSTHLTFTPINFTAGFLSRWCSTTHESSLYWPLPHTDWHTSPVSFLCWVLCSMCHCQEPPNLCHWPHKDSQWCRAAIAALSQAHPTEQPLNTASQGLLLLSGGLCQQHDPPIPQPPRHGMLPQSEGQVSQAWSYPSPTN